MTTAASAGETVLAVHDLRVDLSSGRPVVEDISFGLRAGETLGLVGESGSGKTTVALALLGYAREGMRIAAGSVTVAGQDLALNDERATRKLRGRVVSHVPQDPATSLNPSLRIGASIGDVLASHTASSDETRVLEALQRVGLPSTRAFARRFPHQLSGGQQQRTLIAAALVCEPPLVVLDEPTTGLDVVTQARVLDEVRRLRTERGIAMVYVSHDLAVVSQVADRIAVMYAGRVVEEGPSGAVLTEPRHPYTRGLVSSIPDHAVPRELRGIPGLAVSAMDRPPGCAFAPRCEQRVERCVEVIPPVQIDGARAVRCHEAARTPAIEITPRVAPPPADEGAAILAADRLHAEHRGGDGPVVVATDVTFEVARSECVALVGESGSGKTTIARAIIGLHPPASGRILLDGEPLAATAKQRTREQRRRCQIVFQNPYESLNPHCTVADEIARPARLLRGLSSREGEAEAQRQLEHVRLSPKTALKRPRELSGGERQRVALARALAARPDIVICDEITSALDVSVQASVIELLSELRRELGLSLLFITHDLGVVASLANRVLVLDRGRICEQGPVHRVFVAPEAERTRELLEAAPRLQTPLDLARASAIDAQTGRGATTTKGDTE